MKTSVEIDDALGSRIQRLADLRRQPTERLLQDAIAQYADRMDARESFLREADASWETYQNDGLHLTGDEVRAWLKAFGTDHETLLPECHE